jgi:hypothetical protein
METNDYISFDDDINVYSIWNFKFWGEEGMLKITDMTVTGTDETGFSKDSKNQTQSTFSEWYSYLL